MGAFVTLKLKFKDRQVLNCYSNPKIIMGKSIPPELKNWIERKILLVITGNQQIVGTLRGFDHFLNLVLDQANFNDSEVGTVIIRGQSIVSIQTLTGVPLNLSATVGQE